MNGYPRCDEQVKRLADELYGDCNGQSVTEHRFGKGRVVWGIAPEKALKRPGLNPISPVRPRGATSIARLMVTDIYFVSNQQSTFSRSACTFRVSGKAPELWRPESGRIEMAPSFVEQDGVTTVVLTLGPSESVFVVFRNSSPVKTGPVLSVSREGKPVWSMEQMTFKPVVQSARYGILDDPAKTRDVKDKAQKLVDAGECSFQVARMAEGDDPAYGIVKKLVVECELDGHRYTVTGPT